MPKFSSKLSEAECNEIIEMVKEGYSQREVAECYEVASSTISRIIRLAEKQTGIAIPRRSAGRPSAKSGTPKLKRKKESNVAKPGNAGGSQNAIYFNRDSTVKNDSPKKEAVTSVPETPVISQKSESRSDFVYDIYFYDNPIPKRVSSPELTLMQISNRCKEHEFIIFRGVAIRAKDIFMIELVPNEGE